MSKGRIIIKPQPGPQEQFLATPADICIYGGAAGGGKTYGLLMEAMRHKNNGDYGAVIFRRNYTQVTAQQRRKTEISCGITRAFGMP